MTSVRSGVITSGQKSSEIEGLRAIAVAIVVIYHADLFFRGGFIGVDVFFVVSGFLITGLLLSDHEEHQASFRRFYARRFRRLLPVAGLVLSATLIASWLIMNPVSFASVRTDGIWASLFLANVHFVDVGVDYMSQTASPSPLQHWWSLAVEEQFYFVWPLVVAIAWRIGRKRAVLITACLIGIGSFGYSVYITPSRPVEAYFLLPTRAFELAAGAVLVTFMSIRPIAGTRVRAAAGWLGLVGIFVSALVLTEETVFPGWVYVVPTVCTVMVLMSIGVPSGPLRLLRWNVFQWVGARSYSLYLWHWPLLVLYEVKYPNASALSRGTLLVIALWLSALSYRFFENPIRRNRRLSDSPALSLLVGASAVFVGIGFSQLPATVSTANTYTPSTVEQSTSTTIFQQLPMERLAQLNADEIPIIDASSIERRIPTNLTPSILKAPKDKPSVFSTDCLARYESTNVPPCVYGSKESTTGVALFGDSHMGQWFPGIEKAAIENGWRLEVMTKMGCPPVDVSINTFKGKTYRECDQWRENAIERIIASDIKVVILGSNKYDSVTGKGLSPRGTGWWGGLRRVITRLQEAGKQVVLFSDSPSMWYDKPQCLAENTDDVRKCGRTRQQAVRTARMDTEKTIATELNFSYVDVTRWVCGTSFCPAIIGSTMVYMDSNHVSATFTLGKSQQLGLVVEDALLAHSR
jgi:peptidoglycan/LPS O-acetylase OafA/YrhL